MTPPRDPREGADDETPIRTRAAPPRPRRLSRKALVLLAGTGAFAIAAALTYSLSVGKRDVAPENVAVGQADAEALTDAPKDYEDAAARAAADVPPPGPPAETLAEPAMTDPSPASPEQPDTEEQRRRQQQESARGSKLFAAAEGARPSAGPGRADEPSAQPITSSGAPSPSGLPPSTRDAGTVNSGRVEPPPGDHVILAGSTIAGALVTGVSSDLPGQVIAQVTEDVFDSVTGRTRLIPQGARLLGTYDARVRFGQDRAMIVWNRLLYPDGRSVRLDDMNATDGSGAAGLTDRVDNHWGRMIKAGLIATLLGVGTELGSSSGGDAIADAIRDSGGDTVGRAGDRLVEREMEVRPTISIRPGARVRVLVSRDLVLEPH